MYIEIGCPRCGGKKSARSMYCKKCLREMGKPVTVLERNRVVHLLYCFVLVLANVAALGYLYWKSYM